MKTFTTIAAAVALFAVPAAAQAQAFIQAEAGLDSISVDGESNEGVSYGVTAGYDVPLDGSLFFGIQGTVSDSTTKECGSFGTVRACIKSGRDLSAALRLGSQIGDRSKLYVLGGYTNARIRATYTDSAFPADNESYGENGDGIRVGAGAQFDLSDMLFVKAEYRYSNYEADFSRHNGIVALGAKF